MRFHEIVESFIDIFEASNYDTDYYGNWIVDMSTKPIVMGNVTGPKPQYVARLTHKNKKNIVFLGAGPSQAVAREEAFKKAQSTERTDDPEKFKSFTADLNVDFSQEYHDAQSTPYFKFTRESGKLFLVRASKAYFNAFGREIEQLGFRRAAGRLAQMGGNATQIYGFPVSKNIVKSMGMIPNMRYTLEYVNDDEDGNAMFEMVADTRSQGPQDKYRMKRPGITISGTLADSVEVGLI
jgi:hypothetical protein